MAANKCAECGHPASETARFCERCGAALTPDGAPLRAPDSLAAKILSERAGIEGERKQVTVMFTDIVGSMDLTRSLDTERWGVVLDRFLAIASGAVHGLEGTVNQFTGDGLMAVFGAPVAHEDHARRACLAVLELQRDVAELADELARTDGIEFSIRCGLNSGEVIVGSIGDDLHMDFAPIGNTTALGKRMESLAPVGSTAVSGSTAALVEGQFELTELGEFEVKGAGPQRVLELVGRGAAQTRLEAAAATRGLSRFVGRDAERAALEAALDAALKGQGGAIGIVGEAGVGKSRLVRVFAEACRERGITVNSAGAVAHGRFVPFLTALAMYRDYFGIGERDDPEAARERIEAKMLDLDSAFEADLPLLFDFLGVADPDRPAPTLDPDARQHQLLEIVTRSIKARSDQEVAVLVIEDLHWIDDASAVFLAGLVDAVVGSRTLLVATYRPEHEAAWTVDEPHRELSLAPLDEAATGELLADLLGSDPSLDGLAELIEARTGGNPFFVEEIVQALAETGYLSGSRRNYRLEAELEELVLPATVQASLAARIDRLPRREKALLQTMSVIGKEVPAPLLSEVSELGDDELAEAVVALADAEFVTPRGIGGDHEYVFKHPLTQEVAYTSQLSKRRARAHGVVAAAIERVYSDTLDERAALLAQHSEAAGDELEAGRWHARAASWAEVTSPADGMRHWQRVRALCGELDPSPEVDELATKARIGILGLAWRLGMSPEETAAIHAEGQERGGVEAPKTEAVLEESERERLLLDANYAQTLAVSGSERESLEIASAVFDRARESGDPHLPLVFAGARSFSEWLVGSVSEGSERAREALDLAGEDVGAGAGFTVLCPYASALVLFGACAGYKGELDVVFGSFDRAITIARDRGDAETECYAFCQRSWLEAELTDDRAARDDAERALEIAERIDNTLGIVCALTVRAVTDARADRFEEALNSAERTLEIIDADRVGLFVKPMLLSSVATARLGLDDRQGAVGAAEEAVEIMEARGLTVCALRAPIALAQVLIATEGAEAAERVDAVLAHAIEVARASGARIFEPQIHRELAALARLRGDDAVAKREEAEIERLQAEIGSKMTAAESEREQVLLDFNYAASLAACGREREGLEMAPKFYDRAWKSGDPGLTLAVAFGAAAGEWFSGSASKGFDRARRALELAGDDIDAGVGLTVACPYALTLVWRGVSAGYIGRLDDGFANIERGAAIARDRADLETECYAYWGQSMLEAELGENDAAVKNAERGLEIGERADITFGIVATTTVRAIAAAQAGRYEIAVSSAERALAIIGEHRLGALQEPNLLASIARSRLALGDPEGALAAAEEAVEIMESRGLTVCAIRAPIVLARVLIETQGAPAAERIEAVLARAMEVARASGARIFEPQIHRELAALARLRGDEEAAEREESEGERIQAEIRSKTPLDDSERQRLLLDFNYTATLALGGREREALEKARGNYDRALESGDPGIALAVAFGYSWNEWVAGSASEGIVRAQRVLDLAGDDVDAGAGLTVACPYAGTLVNVGLCKGYMGALDDAFGSLDRAITLARDRADLETECYAYFGRSILHADLGENDAALKDAKRGLEIAERLESTFGIAQGLTTHAVAEAQASRNEAALDWAGRALATIEEHGVGLYVQPIVLASSAQARLGVGDPEGALAAAEQAVEIMEERGLTAAALRAPLALAHVLLETEGVEAGDRIEAVLARAMEVARASGARIFEPQIHRELASLARVTGDKATAEREESEATRIEAEIKSGSPAPELPSREQLLLDFNYVGTLAVSRREREALEMGRGLYQRALESGDPDLTLAVAWAAAAIEWFAGSAGEGVDRARRALDLAGEDVDAGRGLSVACPYAMTLAWGGLCAGYAGELGDAFASFDRGTAIARDRGDPESECYAHWGRSMLEAELGESDAALEHAERGLELAERTQNSIAIVAASTARAVAATQAGRYETAVTSAERALAVIGEHRVGANQEPNLLASIARSRLGLGDPEAAIATAEEAVGIMEGRGLTVCALRAPITLAQILLETEGVEAGDRIEAVLARAMEVARASGARIFEPRIHRVLAALARLRGDEAAAEREEAEAERLMAEIKALTPAERAPSAEQLLLEINYGATLGMGGREREALELWQRIFPQAMSLDDPGLALTVAPGASFFHWLSGPLADGVEMADRALSLAGDQVGAGSGMAFGCPYALTLAMRGVCRRDMGFLDDALGDFERATELARERHDPETECYANGNRAFLETFTGDYGSALEHAARGLELAERLGSPVTVALSCAALAAAQVDAGRFSEALARSESALSMIREKAVALYCEPLLLGSIARSRLGLGEAEAARLAAEEAVEIMEARGLAAIALPAPIALANVLIATEGVGAGERIEAVLSGAMEVARASGARIFEPQIHRERAALARLHGDVEAAEREEAHAERIMTEIQTGPVRKRDRSRQRMLLDFNYVGTLAVSGHERQALEMNRANYDWVLDPRDPGLALAVAVGITWTEWVAGSAPKGFELASRALELAGDDVDAGSGLTVACPFAFTLAIRGWCAGYMGELDTAFENFDRAISIAGSREDAETECYALLDRSWLEAELGEDPAALEDAERGLEIAERIDNTLGVVSASTLHAVANAAAGRFEAALTRAEQTRATITERRVGLYLEPMLLASLSRAQLGLGDPEGARGSAEEAVEIMDARGLTVCALRAPIALAQVLLATEGAAAGDRIEAVLARAMEVARASSARIFEPQIHRELAALARVREDEAAAEREEAAAERIHGEIRSNTPASQESSAERLTLDVTYAYTLLFGRREREGLELLRGLSRQALASADPALILNASGSYAYANWLAGSLTEALEAANQALDSAGGDPSVGAGMILRCPLALLQGGRGLYLGYMGELDRAWRDFDLADEFARENDDPEVECYGYLYRSVLEADLGEVAAAVEHATTGLGIAERIGDQVRTKRGALAALAAAEVDAGRLAQGLERAEAALAPIDGQRPALAFETRALAAIAAARLGLGDPDGALAAAEEAVEIMESRGLTVCALRAPIALAQVLRATEGAAAGDRIEAVLARAMEVTRASGARIFEPQIHRELAALARLRGDHPAAEREEAEAERILAEVSSKGVDQLSPAAEQIQLEGNYAATLWAGGREREGRELERKAHERALDSGDPGLVLTTACGASFVEFMAGSLIDSLNLADRALELAGDDPTVGSDFAFGCPYALALAQRGLSAGCSGDAPRGEADLERALQIAREHDDPEVECYARLFRAWLQANLGEPAAALAEAERAVGLAEDLDTPYTLAVSAAVLADACVSGGNFSAALETAAQTLARVREIGLGLHLEPMLLATIARSNLGLGRVEEALGAAEEAVEIMEARGFTVFALEAPIALARVLNSSGDAQAAERIESVLARALEVARASAARIFEPQIHRELAALARLRGDEAAAEREEAEAERILAEIQSGPGRDGDPSAEQHPDQVLLDQNYAASLLLSGREREGLALARQANQRATRSSDPGLKLTASCGEVLANAIAGSAEDGLAAVVRGLEAAGDDTAAGAGLVFACPYGLALSFRGFCAGAIGHTDRAAQDFERAIEVTRSHGDRESESYAHSNRAFVDEMSGQVGPATLTHSQRAFDLAEQAGNPLAGAAASTAWAVAEVATGSLAEGLERADSTLTTIRERGTGLHYIPALLTSIALARLGLGDRGAALASAEEAVDIMNSRGLTVCALLAPITLAWLLIETEGAAAGDRIEAILARATDVVEKSGARVFEPQIRELADQLAVR